MSLIPLGFWAASGGGAGVLYRLQSLAGANAEAAKGSFSDIENYIYVCLQSDSVSSKNDYYFTKLDPEGVIQWQKVVSTNNTSNIQVDNSVFDSNGFIYGFAYTNNSTSEDKASIVKMDSSGSISWENAISPISGQNIRATQGGLDSSGNLYVGSRKTRTSFNDAVLHMAKFNSSGVLQWQKDLANGASGEIVARSATVNNNNDIYQSGYYQNGSSIYGSQIVKYNSAGTLIWQRSIFHSEWQFLLCSTSDLANNFYMAGNRNVSGFSNRSAALVKYDSSGSLLWAKSLRNTAADLTLSFSDVVTDSQNNVYAVGTANASGVASSNDALIVKLNSSGDLQWQRTLGGSGSETGRKISVDSNDNLIVTIETNSPTAGGNDIVIAVLPSDGSLTGTYLLDGINWTYQASSYALETYSPTSSVGSFTPSTPSLSTASLGLVEATGNLTTAQVEL